MKPKYKIKILELFKVKDIVVTKFPDPDRRTVQLFVVEFSEFGGIFDFKRVQGTDVLSLVLPDDIPTETVKDFNDMVRHYRLKLEY
jgi:hypothetical protein